jgi:uridylate kinase
MSQTPARYRRIILKISGESLSPPGEYGLQRAALDRVAAEIGEVIRLGVQVAVVVGGGNFLRGAQWATDLGVARATADYMGMLATVLNALALQEALEHLGHETRVLSALAIDRIGEPFNRRRALGHLEKGRVVILAGGTGNPHVTTDSCASIRGVELGVEVLLKGTKVDGVYNDDPVRNPNARLFDRVTHEQIVNDRLRIMDIGAIEMCEQYRLPVIVFNLFKPGTLRRIILGESLGTLVGPA